MPLPFYRKQFPSRLAFGMPINKTQDQTFDKFGLKLKKASRIFNFMLAVRESAHGTMSNPNWV